MESEQTNSSCCFTFFRNQVVQRGYHALSIPAVVLKKVGCLVHSVFSVLGSLCLLNLDGDRFLSAVSKLEKGGRILADLFKEVLLTINPKAKFDYFAQEKSFSYDYSTQKRERTVLDQKLITLYSFDCEVANMEMEPGVKAHFALRGLALIALVRVLFFRVIDTVIALLAVPAAILTLGKIESVNNKAFATLHFPCVLADVFYFTTKVFNPWSIVDYIKLKKYLDERELEKTNMTNEDFNIDPIVKN